MENLQELLSEFKKLNLPDGEYAVYGSGPLAVRGIRDVHDLDVIVSNSLYRRLRDRYMEDEEKERIKIGKIEIYPPWGWSPEIKDLEMEEVISQAELIKGVRFTKLEDILDFKKRMGRPKDLKDIQLVNDYLEERKD